MCLLFLFALQQHNKNREEKWNLIKFHTELKNGQDKMIGTFVPNTNLYLDTPVASKRCGQYNNHTCNQLKWRKVDSTFVLCVTLSMEKRKKV